MTHRHMVYNYMPLICKMINAMYTGTSTTHVYKYKHTRILYVHVPIHKYPPSPPPLLYECTVMHEIQIVSRSIRTSWHHARQSVIRCRAAYVQSGAIIEAKVDTSALTARPASTRPPTAPPSDHRRHQSGAPPTGRW